ncbi:alpha/beta hydrolase [Streptomyces sp. NBC_01795]|uniref:alpha/beta fold hydrolase n=1 Tax=unclassified Streptomyces TaxID=2593676 RepID=UPI002DD80C7E|nr:MULTISPECIES: alpha/beta hydrolase [unclassified Streptomyces]WSA92513.1 alpha/beta hydrolase [Streptomyces sp. NBC_01795]WSB76880.1 alpha/beta hydrolase [Streptomyces sp. NBC_01775]WSS14847.1 alpha/beta hydrolase [Streptomyces sp. NBC_01186]
MSKPPFLALPSGVRAYRLATERGEFAVHDTGPARHPDAVAGASADVPTALLLPGFTGSKEDFIGLLEPLARAGMRAVAVDGRGQFETGGPHDESAYAQPELARDVLAVARALGRDSDGEAGAARPLHLMGHSLGGLIARAAVLLEPSAFASLTVMSSGPAAVGPSQRQRVDLLLSALPTRGLEAIWQLMRELDQSVGSAGEAPYSRAEAEETTAAMDAFLRRRWLSNVPEQLMVTGRQLQTEPDRVGELAALSLPFHVVSGTADDAWPVPLLDEMALRLGARRTVVPDTGHSPNAERPQETAHALAAFWRSPPAGG